MSGPTHAQVALLALLALLLFSWASCSRTQAQLERTCAGAERVEEAFYRDLAPSYAGMGDPPEIAKAIMVLSDSCPSETPDLTAN